MPRWTSSNDVDNRLDHDPQHALQHDQQTLGVAVQEPEVLCTLIALLFPSRVDPSTGDEYMQMQVIVEAPVLVMQHRLEAELGFQPAVTSAE